MNLQENIYRIKEMMGVINEDDKKQLVILQLFETKKIYEVLAVI